MITALVPVKDLDRSKSRLLPHLGAETARRLAVAMLEDVLGALLAVPALGRVVVVTPDPDAARVARRIQQALSEPVLIDDKEVFTSASIGISTFPFDGEEPETLLRAADQAMYHAKGQGRNQYQFYTSSMNEAGRRNHAIEIQLRHALERCEFSLNYQPLRDAVTGRVNGAEALLRWRPSRHLLLSAEYNHNEVDLPEQRFRTRIARLRVNVQFTPDLS